MKNKILLFFLSILLSGGLMAQVSIRIGTHDGVGQWKPSSYTSSFSNIAEGKNIAQQIIDIVGLKPNFEVREANVPNAAAVVYSGKRYVLYNPTFIKNLERTTGTKWAGISVLAHEIGHHLNGHTITSSGSQPTLELESDEFSGFVLRKMGASLAEAQAAMKTLATVNASKTHPGQYDRLTAIADGWDKADAQMEGREYVAKSRPQVTQQQQRTNRESYPGNTSSAVIRNSDIIGDIRFNSDPSSRYYVTKAWNLLKVRNNKATVIAKLSKINNRNYPYLIYDEANTQFLVDLYGNIMTKQGKRIGKLTARS
jgi:hypothetical protein